MYDITTSCDTIICDAEKHCLTPPQLYLLSLVLQVVAYMSAVGMWTDFLLNSDINLAELDDKNKTIY